MKIAVFGSANMDILGMTRDQLLLRDSNIGTVVLKAGGVGRNIASRICEHGAECMLFTAFGSDVLAEGLKAECRRLGMDISGSLTLPGRSNIYLCVHDETGDMLTAINDMGLMNALTPEYAATIMDQINACDLCVLDANLSEATLAYAASHATVPLLMDAVSCAKARRALVAMPYLTGFKPNIYEAQLLTGCEKAEDCADKLLELGVKRVFISLGEDGVYYADATERGRIPVEKISSAPKTGAGDALCAGLAVALAHHESTRACAEYGMRSAAKYLSQNT
ncbi:MAG: bifunctional hydroxymethylpyrimidine kinase/phosphomethylpyrimidine kinase [Clostridia bacterium]|nr:bifunctional hydroxymethylpyrimidine kinase/phosphomethylpyrimidine kinase [Clostridia bacterium]